MFIEIHMVEYKTTNIPQDANKLASPTLHATQLTSRSCASCTEPIQENSLPFYVYTHTHKQSTPHYKQQDLTHMFEEFNVVVATRHGHYVVARPRHCVQRSITHIFNALQQLKCQL